MNIKKITPVIFRHGPNGEVYKCKEIIISSNNYLETEQVGRLRYNFFCKKKKWVNSFWPGMGVEFDVYDGAEFTFHFGVFNSEETLLAYARVMSQSFMLLKEFKKTLGGNKISPNKGNSIEITRFCTKMRNSERIFTVSLLFELLYLFCVINGVKNVYAVVTQSHWKLISKKFPVIKKIGPGYRFQPDGPLSVPIFFQVSEIWEYLGLEKIKESIRLGLKE